jgi:hypothetical protein
VRDAATRAHWRSNARMKQHFIFEDKKSKEKYKRAEQNRVA